MGTTEEIVDLDGVVMQAWREQGVAATRAQVEERLIAARRARVGQLRAAGHQAYCWGFAARKSLLTPVGELGPLRVPRLRVDGREVRLIPRQTRRIGALDGLLAQATIGGLSQRRVGAWLQEANGARVCAATVGAVVTALGEAVVRLRQRSLGAQEYAALVVDGIWGRYRGGSEAVLLVAVGVREDGSFDVVDWESGPAESAEVTQRLFTRLWERGWREPGLLVGDGAGAFPAARDVVFPGTPFQLCLWHWGRTLAAQVPRALQRAFRRDFWEVYNGLSLAEVCARAKTFARSWRAGAATAVAAFEEKFPQTLPFLHYPAAWRHRLRTVNLAEGFFRNFRRFFNRFPGFRDDDHLARCLGLYLLGTRPERWRPAQLRLVA